jgi:hypothetical protein
MAPHIHRFCLSLVAGLIPPGKSIIAGMRQVKNEPSKNIFTTGWAKAVLKCQDPVNIAMENPPKWKFNMRFINKGQSGHRHTNCFWTF